MVVKGSIEEIPALNLEKGDLRTGRELAGVEGRRMTVQHARTITGEEEMIRTC